MRCILNGSPREVDDALLEKMVGARPPADFPTNGMGPERLGEGWLGLLLARVARALIPSAWAGLLAAPLGHDFGYHLGGTEADRRRTDLAFGRDVVTETAETGSESGWRVLGGGFLCWLGVSLCGRGAFTYGGQVQARMRALGGFQPARGPHRALRAAATVASAPVVLARLTYAQIAAKLKALAEQQAKVQAKYEALAAAAAEEAAKVKPAPVKVEPAPSVPVTPPKPSKPIVIRPPEKRSVTGARNLYGPRGTPSRDDLAGCISDGKYGNRVAMLNGFADTPLFDGYWTVPLMLEWMGRVSDWGQNGDAVLIRTACHGTNVFNANSPTAREPALCLDINDKPGPDGFKAGLLTATMLADWIRSLPQELRVYIITDACHTGVDPALLTQLDGARSRALLGVSDGVIGSRYLAPPPELAPPVMRDRASQVVPVVIDSMNTVHISGCLPDQTCADARIGGVNCGAYTKMEERTIAKARGRSIREVVLAIGAVLDEAGYSQDPAPHGSAIHLDEPFPIARVS